MFLDLMMIKFDDLFEFSLKFFNFVKKNPMKKVHNFYPGPAILPDYAYEQTIEAIRDFANTGISIMSISHRSKEFDEVMMKAQQLMKDLLHIPEGYSVLFLGGGASTQFGMVPMNFLKNKAFYLDTGRWANKAIQDAQLFGEVIIASSKDADYTYIPKDYTVPQDVDYMHITTNNTVVGTEIKEDLDVPVPLIADMSSDFMSRPIDVSKYVLIYGGAQKNIGPAGVTFVIVKDEFAENIADRPIPVMLKYTTHIGKKSMYNTPPVVNVFTLLKTLEWVEQMGGLEKIHKINLEKSQMLYEEIERNKLFVPKVKDPKDRSIMNVTFVMAPEYKELEKDFLDFAASRGMIGVKGHRSVGGFRASLYNALPIESVKALIEVMREYEKAH